jgi:predicted nucleic acid-binding protein
VIVLDASALLALLHREAGWEIVAQAIGADSATMSAVNYAEVVQQAAQHAIAPEDVDAAVEGLGTLEPGKSQLLGALGRLLQVAGALSTGPLRRGRTGRGDRGRVEG